MTKRENLKGLCFKTHVYKKKCILLRVTLLIQLQQSSLTRNTLGNLRLRDISTCIQYLVNYASRINEVKVIHCFSQQVSIQKTCNPQLTLISGSGEGERVFFFKVLNSPADTRKNPRFQRFMPLREAGSDLRK